MRPWLTYDTPQPLTPGTLDEYQLDVIPTSNVFRKGHRLRLDILPQTRRPRTPPAPARPRRSRNPSAITLPVIPRALPEGEAADQGHAQGVAVRARAYASGECAK